MVKQFKESTAKNAQNAKKPGIQPNAHSARVRVLSVFFVVKWWERSTTKNAKNAQKWGIQPTHSTRVRALCVLCFPTRSFGLARTMQFRRPANSLIVRINWILVSPRYIGSTRGTRSGVWALQEESIPYSSKTASKNAAKASRSSNFRPINLSSKWMLWSEENPLFPQFKWAES